jgi:hypothetical protein
MRLVQQLCEPNGFLGISNLSEVLFFVPLDDLAKCKENQRKSEFSDPGSSPNCCVTWGTISNGLFLY